MWLAVTVNGVQKYFYFLFLFVIIGFLTNGRWRDRGIKARAHQCKENGRKNKVKLKVSYYGWLSFYWNALFQSEISLRYVTWANFRQYMLAYTIGFLLLSWRQSIITIPIVMLLTTIRTTIMSVDWYWFHGSPFCIERNPLSVTLFNFLDLVRRSILQRLCNIWFIIRSVHFSLWLVAPNLPDWFRLQLIRSAILSWLPKPVVLSIGFSLLFCYHMWLM